MCHLSILEIRQFNSILLQHKSLSSSYRASHIRERPGPFAKGHCNVASGVYCAFFIQSISKHTSVVYKYRRKKHCLDLQIDQSCGFSETSCKRVGGALQARAQRTLRGSGERKSSPCSLLPGFTGERETHRPCELLGSGSKLILIRRDLKRHHGLPGSKDLWSLGIDSNVMNPIAVPCPCLT